jgi:hypothetical protein
MTENQWLISTNPVEMYTFVKDRVTERQQRFFVEACRANAPKPWNFRVDSIRWGELAEEWCSRMVFNKDISASVVCDLLREIIGNPFRRFSFHRDPRKHLKPGKTYGVGQMFEYDPPDVYLDPAWLQWKSSTIPNLIHAMMNEECDECQMIRGKRSRYVNAGPDSCWEKCSCNDGYTTRAEPQWDMMPIIADALEEAGCTEATILDHLRGAEPWDCKSMCGTRHDDRCKLSGGTGKRPVRHVRGCWVVELLSGGMQ